MDLSNYSLKEIILSGFKSEVNSRDIYNQIADQVSNAMLKDRFKFLSSEEEKHREFFENLFKDRFPGEEIIIPDKTPVPLPTITFKDEEVHLSDILVQAMDAEMAAYEFYRNFAGIMGSDKKLKNTLLYFASMEMGHYRLLELEKKNAEELEDYEQGHPMIHLGP
ncbi:ferritin family protein [candidate division WOR-3 bacterium]|nr:ferritin family protein [candidate division WOR-3 bacterium]